MCLWSMRTTVEISEKATNRTAPNRPVYEIPSKLISSFNLRTEETATRSATTEAKSPADTHCCLKPKWRRTTKKHSNHTGTKQTRKYPLKPAEYEHGIICMPRAGYVRMKSPLVTPDA